MPQQHKKRKETTDAILLLRDDSRRLTPEIKESIKKLGYHGIISLDIDGTISDPSAVAIDLWNREKGKKFVIDDLDYFSPENPSVQRTGLDSKTFLALYEKAWRERWADIPPLLDRGLLEELQKYFIVHLVTNRPERLRETTALWLKKNYPSLDPEDIIYVRSPGEKFALGYTHYIDDHHELAHMHADSTHLRGTELYMVMRPWTERAIRKPYPHTAIRVADVNEAVAMLIEKAKEKEAGMQRRRLKSV
jgi:hypothetical protein